MASEERVLRRSLPRVQPRVAAFLTRAPVLIGEGDQGPGVACVPGASPPLLLGCGSDASGHCSIGRAALRAFLRN